jgi:sec-independent protein translocase protein TatA
MIGGMEWIIIGVAAIILLFGAKKIPEFARNLGRARAEFERGKKMVEREIRDEDYESDIDEKKKSKKSGKKKSGKKKKD